MGFRRDKERVSFRVRAREENEKERKEVPLSLLTHTLAFFLPDIGKKKNEEYWV